MSKVVRACCADAVWGLRMTWVYSVVAVRSRISSRKFRRMPCQWPMLPQVCGRPYHFRASDAAGSENYDRGKFVHKYSINFRSFPEFTLFLHKQGIRYPISLLYVRSPSGKSVLPRPYVLCLHSRLQDNVIMHTNFIYKAERLERPYLSCQRDSCLTSSPPQTQ